MIRFDRKNFGRTTLAALGIAVSIPNPVGAKGYPFQYENQVETRLRDLSGDQKKAVYHWNDAVVFGREYRDLCKDVQPRKPKDITEQLSLEDFRKNMFSIYGFFYTFDNDWKNVLKATAANGSYKNNRKQVITHDQAVTLVKQLEEALIQAREYRDANKELACGLRDELKKDK
jgi:hypothetical protein